MVVKLNKVTINFDENNYEGEMDFVQTNDKLTSKGTVDFNLLSRNLQSRISTALRDIELELNGKDTSFQSKTLSNFNVTFNKELKNELVNHSIVIKGFSDETKVNLKLEQLESLYKDIGEALNSINV